MNVQSLKAPRGMRPVVIACLLGAVAGTACLQESLAQQSPSQSLIFADPLKQINWISGPQKISIGDFANVTIPDGYRFADARGAHVILLNANTPVPNDLIGVLANNGGTWFAVLQYDKNGCVKTAQLDHIDSAALLKAVQKQLKNDNNLHGITSLTWQSEPNFDAQASSLTWALQVQGGTAKTLKEGVALLGRHGILEVSAISSIPSAAPALDQIVSRDISFKDGERHSDYQKGDKAGKLQLAAMIAGNEDESAMAAGTAAWVYWVYSGLAICLGFAGVMVLVSRKKSRRHHAVRTPVSASAPAQAASAARAVQAGRAAPPVTAPAAPAASKAAAP
ncbi:MAG: DUF2167 domain-containing protein, partial [Limisphaerales bacterium]